MDAIVKMVAERVGISEEQASQAVQLIVAQLKDRLPGPLGDQLEGMLNGEGGDAEGGDVGDALSKASVGGSGSSRD